MSAKPIHVSEVNFDEVVLKDQGPVLVDFWAEWCGPCERIAPLLDEIADEYAGKLTIAKLNIDENRALARKQGVRRIPTLMLFKQGEVAAVKEGVPSKTQLNEFLTANM
ncbi:thioredoxin TrxA [Stigmatella aurantiaca]|uniref:Thioredoxin n=1 Tax=Stigmatella aurantiaca (strain DW4/3-1) TaxID=378806 RepID=Q09AP2_STIAD|nr:thioredoxin TrxA [Stigmatella aurantiaca]ADO74875.1 Thioredoxin 1 [Stigmatella aurantiaca DW4/3-1]EAU68789.1 thioredoxin [Stigmatella aurantiaca DW4/3-1]